MALELETFTDELDETSVEVLGDPVTYKLANLLPQSIMAFVDHTDKTDAFAGVQITAQDIVMEVFKTAVPVVAATDTITLPRLGKTYNPKDWLNTPSGRGWIILLKLVRS